MDIYSGIEKKPQPQNLTPKINYHFCNRAYVEIVGGRGPYTVDISAGSRSIYQSTITPGMYAATSKAFYMPYHITVTDSNRKVVFDYQMDLRNKKVVVEMGSKSLGDTLAWMPYISNFQFTHQCNLQVVTFHNELFKGKYSGIEFVKPGSYIENAFAWYRIGWFYEGNKVNRDLNPYDPKGEPLQKTAADILGLPYVGDIRPSLNFSPDKKPIQGPYVTIATHSTSQAKYWNYPGGWDILVKKLQDMGYQVVHLSREGQEYMDNKAPEGVLVPENYDIRTIMNYMHHSKLFIGLGSGLSWLSWALHVPTAIISGFSEPWTEMKDCIRISTPEGKCSGCFNWIPLEDEGGWNWCPRYRDTHRQFECTTSITPGQVIRSLIEHLI
jgi:autotransporter strand-loop-strand O-heptosyltransferase